MDYHPRPPRGTIIEPVTHGYPISLDVTDRLIVIIGGGAVAARKAAGLIAAGARHIRCVSPVFRGELPEAVERVVAPYAEAHLHGATLVFAATDSHEVNRVVARDARRLGILVNRADAAEDEPGDFTTPALFREGPVAVTVSAGSPALSAVIRDDLQARLDRRFVGMAQAMVSLRPMIRASGLEPARRAKVFRELAGTEALDLLQSHGIEALNDWLRQHYPELKHRN